MEYRSINTYKNKKEANIQQSSPHKHDQQSIYYITQRPTHIKTGKLFNAYSQCSDGTIVQYSDLIQMPDIGNQMFRKIFVIFPTYKTSGRLVKNI